VTKIVTLLSVGHYTQSCNHLIHWVLGGLVATIEFPALRFGQPGRRFGR